MPGRYQVTGNGGSMHKGDTLLVTLKGSKDLSMRLTVESVRHLINPRGQWVAVASGPVFNELEILTWQVACDSCDAVLDFEFAVDAKLGKESPPACRQRARCRAGLGQPWRKTLVPALPGERRVKIC